MVFAIRGDLIDGIVGFPQQPKLFVRLGLPVEFDLDGATLTGDKQNE